MYNLSRKIYTLCKSNSCDFSKADGRDRNLLSLALAIVVFVGVYLLVEYLVISSFARIMVEMEGPVASKALVYYSTSSRHDAFSQKQTSKVGIYDGGRRTTVKLDLDNNTVKKLRLDPGEAPGVYRIYSITLLSFFGKPVHLVPFAPELTITGGPETVVTKKDGYLEITGSNDDPYCIFHRSFGVLNPSFQFGVPLVFAFLTFVAAGRIRPAEFRFWKDVQDKKSTAGLNYQPLDGLRGLAALLVLVDHSGVPGCDGMGMIGVVIFFSLSGFLLTMPFAKDGAKILNFPYLQDYILRRVRRIAPMFYAIILVVYVFNGRIEDALRSALFLQGNTIYWTILQEMHFYLLLPPAMLICHMFLRGKGWLIAAGLLMVSYAFNNNLLSTYKVYGMGNAMTLHAGVFFTGMTACYIFHIPLVRDSKLLKALCGNHFLVLGLLLAIILADHIRPFFHGGHKASGSWVLIGNFNYLVAALIFALVISDASWAARFLRLLPLRLLGLVSYSFYLLHPIFIKAVRHVSHVYLQDNLGNIATCIAALVLTFLVSTITYTLIERPFTVAGNGP